MSTEEPKKTSERLRIYTESDSREVRKAFADALAANPQINKRRKIISFMEWRKLEKGGADMSKYITFEALQKQERKRQVEEMKAARENKRD